MRIALALFMLATCIVSASFAAQQVPRADAGGDLAERFRQYDKNGDGKVTREETSQLPLFDQWDANKDEAVTLEEVTAFYANRPAGQGADVRPAKPALPAPASRPTAAADGFVPDAPFVGEIGGSYIDPEFSEAASQVVFQDMQNRVWIGDIDPATGLFKTATGRDYLMDDNITIIFDRPPQGRKFSTNGPEWTRDDKGHLVVYTKVDEAGIMQQWAARWADGKSVVTQLTHQKYDCYGNMPSRFQDGKPPRVAYTHDWPIWKAKAAWIFLDQPDAPRELANFDYRQMSMWSAVSPHFLFVQTPPGAPHGQIAMSDAERGAVRVLTDDAGAKDDPGLFLAPEFGGEMLLVCNVDNSALAIYRDEKKDGKSPWTRIATLTLPADAPHKFISSPETIASATGIGGVSYFALLARESKDRNTPGTIWVLGLGKDSAKRFVRRVDHAANTGTASVVLEPEPFVGKNEVFVYYNFYDRSGGKQGLRRAATGIKVAAASTARHPAANPAPARKNAVVSAVPELAKPSLEVCLTASDEAASRRFLSEGLGLVERPAPSGTPGRLLLFTAGDSTIKVRQHNAPKTPPAIAARNGLRVLTVPVEKLDDVVARLQRLGFECSAIQKSDGTRWALARNADGTPFELIEGRPGDARQLEIGLVVPDLARAREFFTAVYGAKELTEATSRVLPGEREMRFTTGATVFKCWSPPGERESDSVKVADLIGFRYITHNVRDSERLHDAFQARGIEIATPLTNYRGIAKLFFARGPGGVLLEFLTIGQPPSSAPASEKPVSNRQAKHLVMVCIDACRPDYFSFTDIPNITKLMADGVTYDQAWVGHLRNDTPPGHATLATGVFPAKHGVIGFHWQDPATGRQFKPTTWFGVAKGQLNDFIAKSGFPSIGSIYKQAFPGSKVAAFSSDKFYAAAALGADSADFIGYCRYEPPKGFGTSVGQTLSPETVTGRQVPAAIMSAPALKQKVVNPWDGDSWTVDFALQLVAKEKPEILLLNLALCDDIGHTHGANLGQEQMAGIIANADRQLGRLMEAYRQAGILDKTIFVITSDHGMSANLRTIDETPMASIVSEYGMKRSAARLEFCVNNPAKAKAAAEKIARLRLEGIHAVYYKEQDGRGGYHYLPAPGTALDATLDACYRYLMSTYASPQSVDLVCFSAENWDVQEATSYFKGDHGTVTWENQHVPLILAGPGLKQGMTSHAPARLVDIAPTVLAAMGLTPDKMDGVVLADALASPADALVRAQQTVNAQLTPLKDALKQRHDQDVAAQAGAKPEPPRPTGQSRRMDRNERWPTAGEGGTAAAGGAAQYFKQLDRNSDGKVTREEAGNAPWFERLDRNKDGAITWDELGQTAPATPQRPAGDTKTKAVSQPDAPSKSPGMKRSFQFTRDYTPGTKDAKGKMRTGQELMRLIAYRGQLFASTSTFTDPRLYTDDPDYTGCQVLCKSSSQAEWQVDAAFGKRYLRTDCLEVIRFTQDANGRPLPQPVEMLVAGIWDNGSLDGRRERFITIATRNDATGEWTLSQGPSVAATERGFASVRAMKLHRDQVTGREYLFVGAACGGLYKVVHDPSALGRVRWIETDELDKSYGRIHSLCICNDSLYVSADYGGLLVQNQSGGVFRRIDGAKPTWERVYRNYDPKYPTWNQTGRGITAVPAEDGSGKEVILVGIEDPPEAVIVRIEPHHDHKAVVELNYHDYCRDAIFRREFLKIGGSAERPAAGADIAALNYFEPFIEPETGKTNRFVTLIIAHPDDPAEGCNNAYFLIRRAPGVYDWGEIPSGLPLGENLRGTRTVAKSPFPDEPNVYYFGGFFGGPDVQPARPNLAWTYRGIVGARERGTVKSSPLPPRVPLVTFESAEHGFSFGYPQNLAKSENAKPLLLVQANNREPPTILADAVAASSVKEAVTKSFNQTFATHELEQYTERNEYFAGRQGVAGNIGGRVVTGRRFTFKYVPGPGQAPVSAVGVGWSKGSTTQIIVVSYWGACTEAMANYQLNTILATLTLERGAAADRWAAGGAAPKPPQGAGQFDAMLKSLDKNGDGKITKQEAGGAPWFDRVDQNNDGVLDAAELETVRKASGAWAGGGAAPRPGTPAQGGDQIIERIKSLDTNGDGKITKEEAGGAAWFGRADQNNDGVIDAAELEALRRDPGARRGAINR